jgi:hypothetical protein
MKPKIKEVTEVTPLNSGRAKEKELIKGPKPLRGKELKQKEDLVFAWKLAVYYHLGNSFGFLDLKFDPEHPEVVSFSMEPEHNHYPHNREQTHEYFKEASAYIEGILDDIKRNKRRFK